MHKTLFLRIMCTMKKAITTVHTLLVIVALIATAGWSAYYLINQRTMNSEIVAEKIPVLANNVSDFLAENDSLYNNDFSDRIKALFSEDSNLTALTIYSYDTGIEYFYSRNNQVKIRAVPETEQAGDPAPSYKGLTYVHTIGTMPLNFTDKPGSNIDCVFTVLPGGSIFYVLKISLIIVIALFFITLLLIVIFSMSVGKGNFTVEEEEWNSDSQDEHPDAADVLTPDLASLDEPEPLDLNISESQDEFSLPSEDSDFGSLPDLDEIGDLDIPEEESLDLDDLNLEESIPDIPDNEDLLAMDHLEEASPSPLLEEDFDDFAMPEMDEPDDFTSFEDASPVDSGNPEQPSLYNPDSGLGWEDFLEERLSLELERAASFDQDLVLIIIRNNEVDKGSWESLTAQVKEKYSYSDLVFEAGDSQLAVIDPNKDLDESIGDVQNLLKSLENTIQNASTVAGLSSRNGRLISGSRLIKEASTSLNKADTENPIVGFRSDPERFREFLGKNS